MISLTYQQFNKLTQKGNLIPLYAEIPADLDTPVSVFLKIRSGQYDFLLESVEGGDKWGRYSFLGTNPGAIFRSRGLQIEEIHGNKTVVTQVKKDPLEALEKIMKRYKPVEVKGLPRFFGGAVGYLAYDMVRYFETLPQTAKDDLNLYESYFMITDTVVLFDNHHQVIKVVANVYIDQHQSKKELYNQAIKKIHKLIRQIRGPHPVDRKPSSKQKIKKSVLKATYSEKQYCELVEKTRKYIKAGDIFQTVLSTRFEGEAQVEPFELYRSLRRINPSPYLYFLQLQKTAVVGASPEVMVRLEDRKVELRPIAGTRRRGKDLKEDLALEMELKNDPKERAEHIMLVDLGRNDVGRVCKIGTVQIDELEVVERYSHVLHLVSHVSGILKKGYNAFDLIRATFPAGTLSGAPKIRAMEIIEELEQVRRGIYGGCIGYISFNGNLDTAIAIRTAVFEGHNIYVQAGAGIVDNSIPKLEYKECQNKARAVLKALEMCGVERVKGKG